MTNIVWAQEKQGRELDRVGGKGANLGEMTHAGLPVPPAFTVTADAFQAFVDAAELAPRIDEVLEGLDVEDNKQLTQASKDVQALILEAEMPKAIEEAIRGAYQEMAPDDDVHVAVRSSATAEDLPDASFAGQQETFLHVRGADSVVEHVRECWASLYTPRAIYYRVNKGFDHGKVQMGVVVQRMVDADLSGVLFTRHPTTGERTIIIEAAWGLGEGVVSGQVSPDNYVVNPDGELIDETIATKKIMVVPGEGGTGVQEVEVPEGQQDDRVLDDDQIAQLARLANTLDQHYDAPQDVEWAFEDGELYVLQTRPITTIDEDRIANVETAEEPDDEEPDVLIKGLGASPGDGAGSVVHLASAQELDKCQEGDILVTTMTTPDMVPAMKRAAAIVTDEGGMTCHAAIVSRELGIPCVVGTKTGTQVLDEGLEVTVHGDRGTVTRGATVTEDTSSQAQATSPTSAAPSKPVTATEVKVNVSMPEATERARATDADGVGLLRIEHIVLGLGEHPMEFLDGGREDEYIDYLVKNIRKVAEAFYPRPVWVRTLDAPTDEFRDMPGGDREPNEANPMLGFRGIRRSLEQTKLLEAEFTAIKRLHDDGVTNVGVMLPLVQSPHEIREAKQIARSVDLDPDDPDLQFGIMIEIPAAALIIDDLLDEGLDFVSFGTNDLTQYTLAVDRNNENVAPLFSEFHPAIGKLVQMVIEACQERGVQSSICGQAGSDPRFVTKLIQWGITSVSANIDAVAQVRETVARVEQRLLLDAVREGR